MLGVLGRPADAVAAYQQVINRYGDDPVPTLREAVARQPLLSRKPETVEDLTDPTLWWAAVPCFNAPDWHRISVKDPSTDARCASKLRCCRGILAKISRLYRMVCVARSATMALMNPAGEGVVVSSEPIAVADFVGAPQRRRCHIGPEIALAFLCPRRGEPFHL